MSWRDRPHRDPGLAHRHEQVGQPAGGAASPGSVRATDEAPVGQVCQRGPDLLPGDRPLVAGQPWRSWTTVGEVGAGAGFGVALAPQLGDVLICGRKRRLLLRRAERDQRRAEQLLADVVDPGRRVGAGVLLVEDHLLLDRRAAAAVLDRPAEQVQPAAARCRSHAQPLLERLVLAARAAVARAAGANSPARLAASQSRTSARNASSGGRRWLAGPMPVRYPTKHLLCRGDRRTAMDRAPH